MNYYVPLVFILIAAAIVTTSGRRNKWYRTDYEYNEKTDAYYKLHRIIKRGWQATKICNLEGANLLDPTTREDAAQFQDMMGLIPYKEYRSWTSTPNIGNEYDLTPKAATPVEWQGKVCDARNASLNVIKKPCTDKLPFICKVEASALQYNEDCDTYIKDYIRAPGVDRCYKVPRIALPWDQARAECQAEGAELLVLNSVREMLAVKNFTQSQPIVLGSWQSSYLHSGFKVDDTLDQPRIFKTIFDMTLEESGYAEWSDIEPNNRNGAEACGSVYTVTGKLNDLDCTLNYGFICEKESITQDSSMFTMRGSNTSSPLNQTSSDIGNLTLPIPTQRESNTSSPLNQTCFVIGNLILPIPTQREPDSKPSQDPSGIAREGIKETKLHESNAPSRLKKYIYEYNKISVSVDLE